MKRFALTVRDLGSEPRYTPVKPKRRAHTFGLRSQLITESRNYSTTFMTLRSAQTDWHNCCYL
ncbi:MAG: replication initiator [Acidimicrobiales bacterium]